jgi:hypothetical protein
MIARIQKPRFGLSWRRRAIVARGSVQILNQGLKKLSMSNAFIRECSDAPACSFFARVTPESEDPRSSAEQTEAPENSLLVLIYII